MNPCPICQKPVDPLRASHIRVVGVRVIAYCSAACRDADAARAAATLSTEAAGAPATSAAPVAPTSAAAAKSAPVVAAGKDAARSAPVAPPANEPAKPVENKAAEPPKGKDAGKPGKDAKDAKPAEPSKLVEQGKASKDDKPAKGVESKKLPDGKDGKAAADKAAAKPEAKSEVKSEVKPDAKLGADARSAPGKDAAKPAASAAAKVATAVDAKDAGKPAARNADEERDNTIVPPEPRSRKGLVIAIVLALAVAGVAIWSATRSSTQPAVIAPPPAPVPVVVPPAPPPITPAAANARAVEVLRSHLTVESFRVRRFAAAALGRLGDEQAVQTLLELLPTEQSEIAKLDIAYGLARAGNARGLEMLVTGLRSARRDVKGDAARLLASLKDPRAETTLSSLLSLSQFRLGAAEQLARLGNKQGIAVLERIRNDRPKPPDPSAPPQSPPSAASAAEAEKAAEADKAKEADRLRATVALGYAGQKDVAEELRALLPNTGFNVGAAGALAVLGDPAARPVLVEQLRTPSLRVTAALSLRRLEPALDPAPLLVSLMQDLESEKDVERVSVAETILILTGPASLAERD
jgi:HEAT repeat protein